MKATTQAASRRRRIAAAAMASALVLGLAACSSDDETPGTGGDDKVNITFAWWGSDTRHEVTQKVIAEFEKQHPNIKITPDYTSWDSYFEKLNVAAAGGNLPDVITQEERFLTEYATRDLLLDLKGLGLDTAKIDTSILDSGSIDGKLYGVATGINVHGVVADPEIFKELGMELPDDTTWTWADYVATAKEVSEKSGGKYAGVQNYSFNEVVLKILARQKGEEVFTADGKIGVSEATVTEWFQRSVDLLGKGSPDASASTEIQGAGVEGSLPAAGKGAMAWFWSNQLPAISKAAGRPLTILRAPGESEGARGGQFFKPSMFYSASAKTKHPEEAKQFIDFLINSEEAGKLILTDRGLPGNTDVRASVLPLLGEADTVGATFVSGLEGVIKDGTPVPPVGSGKATEITGRVNSDVLFGTITPAEGAKRWIEEMNAAIS
ncbi:ABC transporter substrate-binding protein [Sanguibacter sp. A247]|uniref:ABC transporter substrate-binding protein n=1 Tax=unclassified Sanguibacter TaxID=2645534 RepID=UPI003FD6C8DD